MGGYQYFSKLGRLFKSSDGGDNWTDIVGSVQGLVNVLAVDPINPLRIYAGTDSGVYRSADGGLSWAPNSDPVKADHLAIDPRDSRVIYAASGGACHKSFNYGENWTACGVGLSGSCQSLISNPAGLFFASCERDL